MVRILITGARGLLGSSLFPALVREGHQVFGQSSGSSADLQADLQDCGQVVKLLQRAAPEIIINLAGMTNVDECEHNPQAAYLGNVRVVENLVQAIREYPSRIHLIQISTDQVYDGEGPHKEEKITLRNYYGFSKYAGELVASSVGSTILRTNFFGRSRCSGRISFSDWLVAALSKGEAITVFDDVRFSPLSLTRLAHLIERVVIKPMPGVYNLGSRNGLSKADFAFLLAEVMNLPTVNISRGTSASKKMAACRPKDMTMDSSRFEQHFGIELPTLGAEIISLYKCATP